ncbi:MAG: hypothetical protein P4L49_02030 [Desulfosporosinus sp.]|nr:hypothetical protein [Desulfosporosinus sp.]
MIRFEEVIKEESITICEQLNSYDAKDSLDFGIFKLFKKAIVLGAMLLITTALTINFYLTMEGLLRAFLRI